MVMAIASDHPSLAPLHGHGYSIRSSIIGSLAWSMVMAIASDHPSLDPLHGYGYSIRSSIIGSLAW